MWKTVSGCHLTQCIVTSRPHSAMFLSDLFFTARNSLGVRNFLRCALLDTLLKTVTTTTIHVVRNVVISKLASYVGKSTLNSCILDVGSSRYQREI
jgi:hypothetical protein